MKKKICIVRHGQTEHNQNGCCSGVSSVGLTALGEHQARMLGKALQVFSFYRILSSDLYRAVQTATLINEQIQTKISYHALLRERDYGSLEGCPEEKYRELLSISGQSQLEFKPPGGESYAEVRQRLTKVVDFIVDEATKGDLVIVAHEGVNRVLLSMLVGGSPGDYPQSQGCLNVVEMYDSGLWRLIVNNSVSHYTDG